MKQAPGQTPFMGRGAYDAQQLDMFKAVLEEAMVELRAAASPLVTEEAIRLTRIRLASAIFHLSDRGETDPARLKRLAISTIQESDQATVLLRSVERA